MKIETIGLRTVWLATLAGWAVLVWLLMLAGMGTQVDPLPDDPALVPRLPALPAPAPERLGEFARYSEIATRPVFAEDRRPHPFFLSGGNGNGEASNVRLTGVLLTDSFRMATLTTEQGQSIRLKLGDEARQGWRLLTLEPRQATVDGPGGTLVLELKVFDGKGGQPPTALATVAGADGRPQAAAAAVPPLPPSSPDAGASNAAAPPAAPAPAPAGRQPVPQGSNPMPSEDQLRAIRERIEARRRQLREQQGAARSGQKP